jgi:hypothetical protein
MKISRRQVAQWLAKQEINQLYRQKLQKSENDCPHSPEGALLTDWHRSDRHGHE